MENFNPVPRKFERVERPGFAGLYRRVDFGRRDAQAPRLEVKAVEFARRLDQRQVAPRRHIVDNGAGGALDIGRYLTLHREKSANRWAKSALLLSSRTGMLAFRRWASFEGLLLNGAATNRRQPLPY